jgi:hypothetical protein
MRLLFPAAILLAAFLENGASEVASGVVYEMQTREHPRPLQIHILRIDLNAGLELGVITGEDPDGDGPAEALLVNPRDLAKKGGLHTAINANAWRNLPTKPGAEAPSAFLEGGHADMLGWVFDGKQQISPAHHSVWSFWIDKKNKAHIGRISAPVSAKLAVSGFGGLLENGKILPKESGNLHPRTAIGIDSSRRHITFVVVDGRRTGVSEGVSERELAEIFLDLGCTHAINLDGGGSSVMLHNNRIVNQPSGWTGPRAIPVLIGIRDSNKERQ